jgi:hypothetical protein
MIERRRKRFVSERVVKKKLCEGLKVEKKLILGVIVLRRTNA